MRFGNTFRFLLIIVLVMGAASGLKSKPLHLSEVQMSEMVWIAKSIQAVNSSIDESKAMEYAVGIHRAATRYGIDPIILIAIAQTETGFRENLPEGAAGEIGVLQIRKMWLKNPHFVAEFRKQTVKDMHKPAKSFMYAAWILRDLKKRDKKGTLPYWSYYNSVKFENRFRYFLAVNRHLATIKMADAGAAPHLVAAADPQRQLDSVKPTIQETAAPYKAPRLVMQGDLSGGAGSWIPDALKKIQRQQQVQEEINTGVRSRRPAPSLVRAAAELGFSALVRENAPVQD